MTTTEPIQIPIEGDATDFIADAKKVQAEMDAMSAKLKEAGVSQSAYNRAVANSKAAQKEAAATTQQAAKATQQATIAAKQSSISITDLRSAYMIAADAARIAGQVWNATGQEFVNYAEQVKNMSRSLGASAEETSRIIQVADDVRISYESLTVAMKTAQKDGVQPNIEGLAKLADQYVAIQSPTEKTKWLLDTFGKSGLEMGKLMEKGGDGIRNMSDAVDESLIITEKGIKASDDYQVALDNWNDSIQAVKISIGNDLLPIMTDLLDHTSLHTRALEIMEEQGLSTYHAMGTVGYAAAYKLASEELELERAATGAAKAIDTNSDAVTDNKEAIEASKDALKDYQDALDETSQANIDNESTSRQMAQDREQYEKDHLDAVEKLKKAQEDLVYITATQGDGSKEEARLLQEVTFAQHDLNEAIAKYGANSDEAAKARNKLDDAMENTSKGGEAMLEAENAVNDATKALQGLEAESLKARDAMVYDMISAKLAVDGLTDSELKALDAYAVSKGIKSQADVDETNRRIEEANTVVEGIKASEDVMVEDKKIAEETKRLETAVTNAEALTAANDQAAAIGNVTLSIDSATLSYQNMAKAAQEAAAAAATIPPVGGTSSSSTGSSDNVMHSRDSGGTGFAGVPYMIGRGAQPEIFIPKTDGTFIPNADKKGFGGASYNIVVNNPKGESTDNSIRKALKNVSYLGIAA